MQRAVQDWLSRGGLRRCGWLLLLPIYWTMAFYPFEIDSRRFGPNRVERIGGGVRFQEPSLLRSRTPPSWLPLVARGAALRVDLEAWTAVSRQEGPARIFTISGGFSDRNLTVGQRGSDLVVRLRRPGSDANGLPPFVVRDVFAQPTWRRLVVDVRDGTLRIEVDGSLETGNPGEGGDPLRLGRGVSPGAR
jgi:hypothetical protein